MSRRLRHPLCPSIGSRRRAQPASPASPALPAPPAPLLLGQLSVTCSLIMLRPLWRHDAHGFLCCFPHTDTRSLMWPLLTALRSPVPTWPASQGPFTCIGSGTVLA